MIIIDYSAIAIAAIFSQDRPQDIEEGLIRHMILNRVRQYNLKFREKYGQTVIACDGGSWRKQAFAQYKAGRKKTRDASPLDWKEFFRLINLVRTELDENFPYPVVYVDNAEADDIIAVLSKSTQEFGQNEPVVIISADKDFLQLHRYSNVKQFSPMKRDFITINDPLFYRFEHICKGDSSDGVPNVLSPDNTFTEGLRQKPMRAKKILEWYESKDNLESVMDTETLRNFHRNREVIDLDYIPTEIVDAIHKATAEQVSKPKKDVLNYLITNRCAMLVEAAQDFQTK
jgi:5'-3' exonuclease